MILKNDIMNLLRMGQWDLERDGYGNLYKRIGTAPVLWSCHLDTVHRKEGWQRVRIDENGIIRQRGMKSRCLGADDGAGIWLLLEMLDKGIEGMYMFHLDEEIGGKGSAWVSNNNDDMLKEYKYAIAFDRKDRYSIITNQWGVCCSDTFGESLSKELGMGHILDSTGRFTDTDNYKLDIPECTNVSVGYFNEHRPEESLDFKYLEKLRDALFKVDINNLVERRKVYAGGYRRGRWPTSTSNHSGYSDDDGWWDDYQSSVLPPKPKVINTPALLPKKNNVVEPKDLRKTTLENIERICSLNARKMARVFLDAGATYDDVLNGFLNLDMSRKNVTQEDANSDGWLSMIAKFVLGGK
jgi:hypothetical protein